MLKATWWSWPQFRKCRVGEVLLQYKMTQVHVRILSLDFWVKATVLAMFSLRTYFWGIGGEMLSKYYFVFWFFIFRNAPVLHGLPWSVLTFGEQKELEIRYFYSMVILTKVMANSTNSGRLYNGFIHVKTKTNKNSRCLGKTFMRIFF